METIMQRLFFPRTHKLQGELRAKEWETLSAIDFRGGLMMSALAKSLGVQLSSATRTVDGLIKKRLVVRSRIESDRRVVRVELSENGLKHQAAVWEERVAMGHDMLVPLSPRERKIFLHLMNKIARLARPGSYHPD
jgi:DNA-binding MarR family transcriptional regulator